MKYQKYNIRAWTQLARLLRISKGLERGTIKTIRLTDMTDEQVKEILFGKNNDV